jgi:multidrug efflux pump subunit AcrA (membrane-fusion protein)
VWPDPSRDLQYLSPTAERTLKERRGIVTASDGSSAPTRDQSAYLGYPIEVSGVLRGAVVLDIAPGSEFAVQRAVRLLHWGSAWLLDYFRQQALEQREAQLQRTALAMDLVATAVQESRLTASALAVANELAARLNCDRVSIGFNESGSLEVRAISHTATFDPKMSLVRLIGEAMDEVLDLESVLVYPTSDDDELGAMAHAELAREFKNVAVCSVPLLVDGRTTGVLTFERSSGAVFDAETVELGKTVGELLGPILRLKRDNERSAWRRARDTIREGLQALFGPDHPGLKFVALLAVGILLFFSLATGTYRVSAKTVIEGAVQRSAVAPFDGHIAESLVRAGDVVIQGQILCRLDDRDLKLEQARLRSEREQLVRKHRQALAVQDRAAMVVLAAQINQVEAQIALVDDKLARAALVAPFDGVVVSGDLNQLLGAPVEQGKILFQIASLDAYRVILEVDERDIAFVAIGQMGELVVSGIPNQRMDFSVQQITPVSTTQDGRNYFRVEAHLASPADRLRPGMEGVGKISTRELKLIWIWTHSLLDWLRIWAWNRLP